MASGGNFQGATFRERRTERRPYGLGFKLGCSLISTVLARDDNGGTIFPIPGCEQHGEDPKVRASESGRDDLLGLRHYRLRPARMAEGFAG